MDSLSPNSERHYKKIIIPDGSIRPNETVIIEVPAEFQKNRTFLSTRGNLNETFSATELTNVTDVLNQTRSKNAIPNATFNDPHRTVNRSDPGKTYGSLNNPHGSQNSPNSCCAQPTASTSNRSPEYNKPTPNYSLNATSTLHRFQAEQSNTIDPASRSLPHLYDSSEERIDKSSMEKALKGEISRELVWTTLPNQRVHTTFNLDNVNDCCRFSGNTKISSQYTDRLNGSSNSRNQGTSSSRSAQEHALNQTNFSRFVPSAQSTPIASKYEKSNYREKSTKRSPHISVTQEIDQTDYSRFVQPYQSTEKTPESINYKENLRSTQYPRKNTIQSYTAEELCNSKKDKSKNKNLANAAHQIRYPPETNPTVTYSRFAPAVQSTPVTPTSEEISPTRSVPQNPTIKSYDTEESCDCSEEKPESVSSPNTLQNLNLTADYSKFASAVQSTPKYQLRLPQRVNPVANDSRFVPPIQSTKVSRYEVSSTTRSSAKNATMNNITAEDSCGCSEDESENVRSPNATYQVSSPQGLNQTANYSTFSPLVQSTPVTSRYKGYTTTRSPPTYSSPQSTTKSNDIMDESCDCGEEEPKTKSSPNITYQVSSPQGLNQTANYLRFAPPVQSTPRTTRYGGYSITRPSPIHSSLQSATKGNNITDESCNCGEEEPESVRLPNITYQVSSPQRLNQTANYSRFVPPIESRRVISTNKQSSPLRSFAQSATMSSNTTEESCDCGEEEAESARLPRTTYQVSSPQVPNQTANYSKFAPPVQSTPITSKYRVPLSTQSYPTRSFPQNASKSNNSTKELCDCSEAEPESALSQNNTYQASLPKRLNQTANYLKVAPPDQSIAMTSRHRGSLTTRSLPKSYPQKATMNSYTTEHSCDCDEDEPNSTTPINNTYKVSSQSKPPQKSALDGTTDYSRFASLVESTGTSSNAFPTRSSPARSPLQNSTIRNYTVKESSNCGKDQYESLPNNTTYQVTSPKGLHQTINYSKFTPPVQSTHMTNKYEESSATQSSPAAFFSTTMSNYSSDCYSDGSKASSQGRVPQRSALDQTINYSRFSPLVQSTPIGTKEQRVPQNATYTVTSGNTTEDSCFCGDETESVNTESDTVGGDYTDTSGSQNPYNSTSSTLNNSSKRVKFSKSSSTVQTYTEESEDLGEEPKVIRTTSKIETAATGIHPSEISMSETRSTPSGQSSRRNISGETISGETINLDNLRQLEEQERTQLAEDLRRMQEARRQLALHAASIGGSTNLL